MCRQPRRCRRLCPASSRHRPQCERGYFSLCAQHQFAGSRSEGGNAEYAAPSHPFRLPPGY
ncbi:hypothetical protein KCP73_15805 [Salmonella enterica subsp. enterica]|nr:hypothetical protein KCP73_15805 [Salmonella enterica subsp. enterica]